MSKGLLILSILLMAGAAVLGWLTRDKVTALKGDLDTTRTKLTSTNMQLTQAEGKAKAAEDEATKTKADLDAKDKELVDEKSKSATAEAKAKQLEEASAAKDAQIADLNKAIADMKGPAGQPVVNVPELQAKLKDAEAKAQEKETLLETITTKVKNLEAESKGLQNKVAQYEQKSMRPGIEGTVMAVNQGWNFVVVDIGDKKGVAMGAELIVKRDGLRIATVKITSVEPNTSVADIVAGSVTRGMHVQPGDRVIFEKGS